MRAGILDCRHSCRDPLGLHRWLEEYRLVAGHVGRPYCADVSVRPTAA